MWARAWTAEDSAPRKSRESVVGAGGTSPATRRLPRKRYHHVSGQPLLPFACFDCRRSFRRAFRREVAKCPACGANAVRLDHKFKAPPHGEVDQWEKVRLLYAHGFRFARQYDDDGRRVPYPRTLEEARTFVAIYNPGRGRKPQMPW